MGQKRRKAQALANRTKRPGTVSNTFMDRLRQKQTEARENGEAEFAVREIRTYDLLPHETVLPDNYPINAMYVYIIDGVFTRVLHSGTVAEFKAVAGVKEMRRCDLFGHEGARLGDKVQ